MSDQLLMDNYLLVLKSTVEVYVHGTLESVNADVKKILKDGLDNTILHQKDTYNEMTKYGWYKIKNVEKKNIKDTINCINKN